MGSSLQLRHADLFCSIAGLNWCALSVTVKWLAVKTASEMTYTVSGGALNSTQSNPNWCASATVHIKIQILNLRKKKLMSLIVNAFHLQFVACLGSIHVVNGTSYWLG